MLSLVVLCAAIAACHSSAIGQQSAWNPWLKAAKERKPEELETWQVEKLQDYKDLLGTVESTVDGLDLSRYEEKGWDVKDGFRPFTRVERVPFRVNTPPLRYLDDVIYSAFLSPREDVRRPFSVNRVVDGYVRDAVDPINPFREAASRPFSVNRVVDEYVRDAVDPIDTLREAVRRPFGVNRVRDVSGDIRDAVEPVVPFSRDFADRYYRSQVYRLPSRLLLPLSGDRVEGRQFEESVRDYYSSRRQYAFNLISEALRFCDCRETRARMKLWWGGVYSYDVAVYRDAVAAETVDDLGFSGHVYRDDIRQIVSTTVISPTTVQEFRIRFLQGLLDSVCDSAKSYVADVQNVIELTHPLAALRRPLLQ